MANVLLPERTWVDLYAATGITIGVQITIENLTPNAVRLAASATEPTVNDAHLPLPFRSGSVNNITSAVGAWALCVAGGGVDVITTV